MYQPAAGGRSGCGSTRKVERPLFIIIIYFIPPKESHRPFALRYIGVRDNIPMHVLPTVEPSVERHKTSEKTVFVAPKHLQVTCIIDPCPHHPARGSCQRASTND